MTYGEVITTILNYAGQGSGGEFEDFVKVLANGVYRKVLDSGNVPHEQREFTLSSVASTSQYGLPLYVRRVVNIEDPTTPRFVFSTTARNYDKAYPGSTTTGSPRISFPVGTRGVQAYPASDGTVTVVSDSGNDSGSSYKIRITGFNTAGVLVTEQLTMNGTTAVTSSNSYDSTLGIERITKEPDSSSTFSGNVTLKDSDGNTLSTIPVWWMSPDYVWIEFYPIPSSAISYNIRCEMRKPPLVNDSDWPEFSADYHELLVYGVTQDLLVGLGKQEAADRHRSTFNDLMEAFTSSNNDRPVGLWQFRDVQSGVGLRQRPQRPLIQGVDFGYVTS